MKIGFTGTRDGMTERQADQLAQLLMAFERATPVNETPEFHHGGAIGADTEADRLASLDGYVIYVHPCPGVSADDGPVGPNDRGRFNGHPVEWNEVFPPLVRNRRIVDAIDVLIAAPKTNAEQLRSGTWATVRYAQRAGKPVVLLAR